VSYLLDTHVWLWMLAAPDRLTKEARELVESPDSRLLLSAASSWEISIKWSLGKLTLPEPPATYVPSRMQSTGVEGLAVEHIHALQVASLPSHHRDPFDRLLVAQAAVGGYTILTADEQLEAYDVEVLRAG
jgi:PIN domain nuclease of toxin-antitoxin system